MKQNQKEDIEKIMTEMDCPSDFECFKSEFKTLCRAGLRNKYTDCLDEKGCSFKHSVLFGSGSVCHCKLRTYVAKNLRK
jgi:hypothetical protein